MPFSPEQLIEERKKYGIPEGGYGTGAASPTSIEDRISARQERARAFDMQKETTRIAEARGGEETELKDVFGNILPSAGRTLSDIFSAVRHPVQTVKAIGQVGLGVAEKLIPGEQKHEAAADAVGQFFKDRYGSIEAVKETFINDPVGFLLDASVVLGGAGTAVKATGTIAKSQRVAKAGQVVQKAGRAIDPLAAGAKATAGLAKKTISGAAEVIGVTTGVGKEVLREAFRNPSPRFTEALRGRVDKSNLLDNARSALQKLKDERATKYQAQLEQIGKQKQSLDISSLQNKLDNSLSKFGVKKLDDGTLDFSRSTISKTEGIRDIENIYETLKDWGTTVGDRTPVGLDVLKRRLGDFYSDSGQARAFVNTMQDEVKSILNKNVKGYADMTKGYREASEFITDVEKSLSLGGKAGTETAIKKLTDGLRQDKEFRTSIIREIDKLTPEDISGGIAGIALKDLLPTGLTGRLFAGGAVTGGLVANIVGMLAALPAFSPRLMGELIRAFGIGNKKIQPIIEAVNIVRSKAPVGQTLFQSGRVEEES